MPRSFTIIAGFISVILFMPIMALLFQSLSFTDTDNTFSELADTVLLDYTINSLKIVLTTLVFSCLFAVAPAWWCARYEFKGRQYLQWAMVLPLAIPAYISAYIYTDMLDYAGPIQTTLRNVFDWGSPQDYFFFDIRSITGASLMLALALSPYIYLLMRTAFSNQSDHIEYAAKMMGASPRRIFFGIRLKLARPALAIGCTLVAMETLADFGTGYLFSISTLTTAIYDSWLVYGSLETAAKISCLLLLFIITFVLFERWQRKDQKFLDVKGSHTLTRKAPSAIKLTSIWIVCLSIIMLGFTVPVITLLGYTSDYLAENTSPELWQHTGNTFYLAFVAAFICGAIALLLNINVRFSKTNSLTKLHQVQQSISSVGYAIPGTVLAIGILIPLGLLDMELNELLSYFSAEPVGLFFSGTYFALILAFVIRFAAIANGSVSNGYEQINQNLDLAAKSLNSKKSDLLKRIHLPLLQPSIVTALLLVFIECVKELPASLLLRPFDFETLATYTYQYASDEQLEHGALAALLIIVVSLIPIFILSKTQRMQ
jgi:iron(III) transport system permease protein